LQCLQDKLVHATQSHHMWFPFYSRFRDSSTVTIPIFKITTDVTKQGSLVRSDLVDGLKSLA